MRNDRRNAAGSIARLGVLALALTLFASTARADVRTEARRHFRRGMELVVQGQLDAGVLELEEAYAILPHPNVLYNIARAFAEAGRYDEALDYFERYTDTDPPDRAEVEGFVQALELRIAERRAAEARTATATATEAEGAAAETGAGAVAAPVAGGTPAAAAVTDEEIAALLESATQFESLAAATGSETLRTRAARLRALAANLEVARRDAAAQVSAQAAGGAEAGGAEAGGAVVAAGGEGAAAGGEAGAEAGAGLRLGQDQTGMYEEEVVSASRYAQSPLDAPNSTTIITRQDIRLSGLTHIGELLRRVAGVQVMNTGASDTNVGIRGFNQPLSPRVLTLINGRSIYIDPLGVTWYDNMPIGVEDVERIEIIRGPASALYGANGFSGIVNIITRDPGDVQEVTANASLGNGDAARAYLGVSGRSRGLGYRVSATYHQYDRHTLAVRENRTGTYYSVGDTSLAQQAITARAHMRYRFSPTLTFNAEGGLNYSGQTNILGTGTLLNLYMNGSISYAMAQLQSSWGGVRVFWNRMDARADTVGTTALPNDFLWNTVDVEPTFARSFDTGPVSHNLVLGGAYRLKTIAWNQFLQDYHENHFSAFFQDAIRFSEVVRAVVGFRMDRHPLLARPVWSPRAALVIRPTDGQAIRVSASTAFRTQAMLESYIANNVPTPVSAVGAFGLGSAPTRVLRGTDPLKPERIFSAEVGYTNSESEYVTLEFSGYYNRIRDLVTLAQTTVPFTVADYAATGPNDIASFDRNANRFVYGTAGYVNDGARYEVYGAELGLRLYPADGLDIYVNGATNLAFAERDGVRTRSRSTPLVQVNGGLQYRSRFGLDVASDVAFQTVTVWGEQVASLTGIEIQNFRIPAYYVLNARVGYRLLEDALELSVSGYNITNTGLRQHPFAQQLEARVMGSLAYRF